MKSKVLIIFTLATLSILSGIVLADVISSGVGANITVGNVPTNTSTTTAPPVNNPANITIQIHATDSIPNHFRPVNITFYDNVNNYPLLTTGTITSNTNVTSPSMLVNMEIKFDNNNFDAVINGLNLQGDDGTQFPILIERLSVNPTITGMPNVFKSYRIELTSSPTYSNIVMKINLADVASFSGFSWGNLGVYTCQNFNTQVIPNVCSDSNGWQPVSITGVDQTGQTITIFTNHFSVYSIGTGNGQTSISTTTTTQATSSTSTSSITTTTTSYVAPAASNPASSGSSSSGSSGGGGGAVLAPAKTTTTTSKTTTTTFTVLVNGSSTSSTSESSQAAPSITGLFSFASGINPTILIGGAVVVIAVAAIGYVKFVRGSSGLGSYASAGYRTYRYKFNTKPRGKSSGKRTKKNFRETRLSM